MPTTETSETRVRRSFNDKLIDSLKSRISLIEGRLSKYRELQDELTKLKQMLYTITGNPPNTPEPVKDLSSLNYNPENISSATSSDMVSKGLLLPINFTPDDLASKLDNNRQKAFNIIAVWKNKGWIDTVARGIYTRTTKFGK